MAAWTETEKLLNMMLIGRTGEGKSSTGNTILGDRLFTEGYDTTSVADKFTRFDDFILKVVDCPGLMGTNRNIGEDTEAAATNMGTALDKCYGGVDAFLLVITRHRFTNEQRQSLEALKQIFGDKYLQNLIVVVTGGDRFQEEMEHDCLGDITFHEWCRNQGGDFGKLYREFKHRFLLINNREECKQKMYAQRREIVQLAETLRKVNGRYTSDNFEKAKALREKLIVEANKPIFNETIQKKVGLLTTDLLKLQRTPSASQRKSIQQSVNDLKKEITEKDRGTGLLIHLLANVGNVETALHDINELHRVAKKLEKTRQENAGWSALSAGVRALSLVGVGAAAAALSIVAAPVAVGNAVIGGLGGGAAYVESLCETVKSCEKHEDLSMAEKQMQAEKNKLESKLGNVTTGGQ